MSLMSPLEFNTIFSVSFYLIYINSLEQQIYIVIDNLLIISRSYIQRKKLPNLKVLQQWHKFITASVHLSTTC